MSEFLLSEKYRLELKWSNIEYNDNIVNLRGAYFEGPVINDIAVLEPNDCIKLDFGKQYSSIISKYYIVDFCWGSVSFNNKKILLSDSYMLINYDSSIPKIKQNDYIVIDTKDHRSEVHHYNLTYKSYLVDSGGALYNFNRR